MEMLAMNLNHIDPLFWKNKNVFLTGHTGFKGSWLTLWLSSLGARVSGYSLAPNTTPSLFEALNINSLMHKSTIADICQLATLKRVMTDAQPDVVIHLAAQPLVRYSYANPVETYLTNVMGTVNVLESTRYIQSIKSTLVVTTDKCYKNNEWIWGYRENDPMGGDEPYSSSKACAELLTSAYRKSFFSDGSSQNNIASARAGNVIGGGDWAEDRLVPDVMKAIEENRALVVRRPESRRPWQHVLEPLSGYLMLSQALYRCGEKFATGWNFGPRDEDNVTAQEVASLVMRKWGGNHIELELMGDAAAQQHEAGLLKLDCSMSRTHLGWKPKWSLEEAVEAIVLWQHSYLAGDNMQKVSLNQIEQYMSLR